jgi:Flp pilus assembly protein TadG
MSSPVDSDRRRGLAAVEAAICLPILMLFMLGMWEVGRMVEIQQILVNAARGGARLAAGGTQNGAPVTVATVQQNVRDYLTSAGLPLAAVNGAQIKLTNQSANTWTDPYFAQPLDKFQVSLVIPPGAAFNSLRWLLVPAVTGKNQLSVAVTWVSLNDSQVSVNSQLPY